MCCLPGIASNGHVNHLPAHGLPSLCAAQGVHLEIEEQGGRGDTVLGDMKRRLQHTLSQHVGVGRPYNWVLLQGGIHDLTGELLSTSTSIRELLQEEVTQWGHHSSRSAQASAASWHLQPRHKEDVSYLCNMFTKLYLQQV
jgi:hypothetical protein